MMNCAASDEPRAFPEFAPATSSNPSEPTSFAPFKPLSKAARSDKDTTTTTTTTTTTFNFQPRPKQEAGAARLTHKDLHFVQLPFLQQDYEWWPCLVFDNFKCMIQVYYDVFPGNVDVRSQLTMEYLNRGLACGSGGSGSGGTSSSGADEVVLVLGTIVEQKSYYQLGDVKRISFNEVEFMDHLGVQMEKAKQDPVLKEALTQSMELLRRMSQMPPPVALPEQTRATPPVRNTTASKSSPMSGTATVVSFGGAEEELSRKMKRTDRSEGASRDAPAATTNMDVHVDDDVDDDDINVPMDDQEESDIPIEPTVNEGRGKQPTNDDRKRAESVETEDPPANPEADGIQKSGNGKKRKQGKKATKTATSAKKAKNDQNETPKFKFKYIKTDQKLSIPTFAEVKALFERHDYVFDKGLYCRPYSDPQVYANVKENADYFTSESSFRAYLCAHGVEYIGAPWDDDEGEQIEKWVRASVIKSTKIWKGMRYLHVKKSDAMRLLKNQLGVIYKRLALTDGYCLPNIDRIFEDKEMWEYLSRNGLPETLPLENISPEERLALEHFIAHEPVPHESFNFFIKREEQPKNKLLHATKQESDSPQREEMKASDSPEHPVGSLNDDDNASNGSPYKSSSPAADKQALEALNPTPKPSRLTGTPVSNLNFGIDDFADSSGDESVGKNEKLQTTDEAKSKEQIQDDGTTTQDAPDDGPAAETGINAILEVDLPGENVGEKLESCAEALRGQEMMVTGKISSQLSKIQSFAKAVIRSKGKSGGRKLPPYLHVCGAPGSGKTMGVKKSCEEAKEWARQNFDTCTDEVNICYINSAVLENYPKKQALETILKNLGITQKQLNRPSNTNKSKRAAIFLILDEIDLLVASKGQGQSKTGSEEFLRTLLSWASDESTLFSLIGISNSVENYQTRRLNQLGMVNNKIVFNTYSKDDLISIVESRIGQSVVDPKMIEFLASKVASTSGDARKIIELVSRSIQACRSKLPQNTLDSELTKPVVKLPHAMMVIRETNTKYKDLVESLTSLQKSTLVVGTHLSRILGARPLTLGMLKKYSFQAFGFDPMLEGSYSMDDFKGIIERLVDSGLLKMAERVSNIFSTEPMGNLLQHPVRFDLQLEDVESALEETLLKEDYYKMIVARVNTINVESI